MSDVFEATIATLKSHLQKQEEDARSTRRLINQLCQRDGTPILYPEAESENPVNLGSLRRDQFYGLPLAGAIRKYLEMRRAIGPATVNDIYSALCAGGFKFEAKNEANAKRSLYISLAKNSYAFHKLPGSTSDDGAVFGLLEWYPNAKTAEEPKKGKKAKKKAQAKKIKPEGPKAAEQAPAPAEKLSPDVAGNKPEKGVSHEENKGGAGSAARKKHNPAPVA